MTAIEHALRTALLQFVWQGAVVAFLLWIALFLLRKRSANARYLTSCFALAALVALPVITACQMYIEPQAARTAERFFTAVPQTVAAVWTGSAASTPSWFALLGRLAIPVWALGVLLLSLRLAWGSRQVAMLRRSGESAEGPVVAMAEQLGSRLGLSRPVRLIVTSLAEGPSVVGWIRPVILLPTASLLGLTPEQLQAVLAHEFAHIRRYDYLVNILQMVVETLLFYHPAVWWTSSRIRHERELCCDDLAVSLCGDPVCYARALTKLERLRTLAPNLALGSTDGPLLYRIQRLTGAATRKFSPSRLPAILAVTVALVCALGMTWTRVHAQEGTRKQATEAPAPAVAQPVADASGVKVAVGGATVLMREPVNYPGFAIEDQIQGTVVVQVTVDATGKVASAQVVSGPDELRNSVVASIQKWNFTANSAQNGPILVTVGFQLPEQVDSDDDDNDNDAEVEMDSDDNSVEVAEEPETESAMTDVESSLQEAESALEEAESELKDKFSDLSSQVDEARQQLEKLGLLNDHADLLDGRKLEHLRVLGLNDQLRNDLLKKLPVIEGDRLSKSTLEKLEKIVRDFDGRLNCFAIPVDEHGATIVIDKK
ncbi:MAG TPA: M56 family metallopeptidase [Bryobacteraceae bacterium]|nr:M56 family metallopeptidase [Bryobacteraceae bacterium]